MATALGFSRVLLILVCTVSGCSGGDPSGELTDTSTEALRSGPERRVDLEESILVSVGDGTILKFSAAGASSTTFAQGLSSPLGLALDRFRNVYVADIGDDTVRRFSESGRDLGIFASAGLSEPTNLAFDASGNLFVVNDGDNSIVKFSAAGKALGVVVSLLGRGCAAGLVFDRSGDLLVADPCYSVVRKFSATGNDLGIFASAGLSNPLALLLEANGNLMVANSDNGGGFRNTIHEFSTTGADLGTFASTGLNFPSSLAFDASGDLLVTNEQQRPGSIDYAIQKLASDGADLGEFAVLSDQPRYIVVVSSPRCR
jgi:hypothetical protein